MRVDPVEPLGSFQPSWIVDFVQTGREATRSASLFDAIHGSQTTSPIGLFPAFFETSVDTAAETSTPNFLAPLYLQYPNETLRQLAFRIVEPSDSNDVKVAKITRWVIRNIVYKTDSENYKAEELWAAPMMTIRKGSGDCEDGAFLIHSLALNAGVPADRLRTYGGTVKAGAGAATGGHGWTAYRRESDNEWVVLDFSYFPETIPTSLRKSMAEDLRYIEDYFYMTLTEFMETKWTNRVRDPDGYDRMGRTKNSLLVGVLVNSLI